MSHCHQSTKELSIFANNTLWAKTTTYITSCGLNWLYINNTMCQVHQTSWYFSLIFAYIMDRGYTFMLLGFFKDQINCHYFNNWMLQTFMFTKVRIEEDLWRPGTKCQNRSQHVKNNKDEVMKWSFIHLVCLHPPYSWSSLTNVFNIMKATMNYTKFMFGSKYGFSKKICYCVCGITIN
jgi:hypothetical protein